MAGTQRAGDPAEEIFVGFARALRAAGVAVTQDRTRGYLEAVALLGAADPRAAYAAGRATLCASPEDLERHDQVFEAWFSDGLGTRAIRRTSRLETAATLLPETDATGGAGEGEAQRLRAMASTAEVLRHRDVAALDP
ncbi:MAG: hypothetical protein QM638_13435, partial [Nocardioides sp.]